MFNNRSTPKLVVTNNNPEVTELCQQHREELTDQGNAIRFIDSFHEFVRYVPTRGWFLFSETHWQPADTETMLSLARESLEDFFDQTRRRPDDETEVCERSLKHLTRCESLPRLHALLRFARAFPDLILPQSSLDADPNLLNLRNGTLNLRSGELLPHTPEHYITHVLPYDYTPEANSALWDSFLDRLTSSDSALQLHLQRAIGSTLFGNSQESTCFILTGPGQRAHHLLLSTLRKLLGSYSTHTFSLQQRNLSPSILASRLLTLSSSTLLHACDPAILSALLNHDPLPLPDTSTELIYEPHTTLWLSAPELPQLSSDLASLREYLQPIPLSLSLTSHEAAQLSAELPQALPAILNWAIQGFHHWQTQTPPAEPACIQQAAAAFHEDQDPIALFLAQSCASEPGSTIPAHELYQAYAIWSRAYGEHPLSASRFGSRVHASGLERTRQSAGRFYHDLKLIVPTSSQPEEKQQPATV